MWQAWHVEFQRFVGIAAASASELEYHFLLAHDRAFLSAGDDKELDNAVIEVKRMLASLIRKIEDDRRTAQT